MREGKFSRSDMGMVPEDHEPPNLLKNHHTSKLDSSIDKSERWSVKRSLSVKSANLKRLDTEESHQRLRRVFLAVLATVKFMSILTRIKIYGTSNNLYKIVFKGKKAARKALYPNVKKLEDIKEPVKCEFMTDPNSRFHLVWDLLLFFNIIYCLTYMPLDMAFSLDDSGSFLSSFDYVMNSMFILDILINFVTGYYDANGK